MADIAVSCGAIALAISLWREDARRGRSRPESARRAAGAGPADARSRSAFTVVTSRLATERLDRFLADQLGLSRTQAARLVAGKAVDVEREAGPRLPRSSPAASG